MNAITIGIFALLIFGSIFLFRYIGAWMFRINEILELLTAINTNLKKILNESAKGMDEDRPQKS